MPHQTCGQHGVGRPALDMAEIFRALGPHYRSTHFLRTEQRSAMLAIEACRTSALGGHLDVCKLCGFKQPPAYNACRNRHCPKCQGIAQAKWIAARKRRLLPTNYFHLVFTLPGILRPMAMAHRTIFYPMIMRAAAETVLSLGRDPKRMGAIPAVTVVLHTWTRELGFHLHVHLIVSAGGLSLDHQRWVPSYGERYIFPRNVLSDRFRSVFIDLLTKAFRKGEFPDLETQDFNALRRRLYSFRWHSFAKRPFGGPHQVIDYLGRYTHRVAISNHRLVEITDSHVRFRTRDQNTCGLTHEEFIDRFLLHILPPYFVKIRHYGLLAPGAVNNLLPHAEQCIRTQGLAVESTEPGHPVPDDLTDPDSMDWQQWLERLTGIDPRRCPRCKVGVFERKPLPGHLSVVEYHDTS